MATITLDNRSEMYGLTLQSLYVENIQGFLRNKACRITKLTPTEATISHPDGMRFDANFEQAVRTILLSNSARLKVIEKNLQEKGPLIGAIERLSLNALPALLKQYLTLAKPRYDLKMKSVQYNEKDKQWEPVAQAGWSGKLNAWFRNLVDSVSCRYRKIVLAKQLDGAQETDLQQRLPSLMQENADMDTAGGRLGVLFAYAKAGLAQCQRTPQPFALDEEACRLEYARIEAEQTAVKETVKTKLRLDLSI